MRAPDISLKQLSALVAVADAGGFTAAAEALFLSQSVLSRTIAALERSVGGPLFIREARRLRTTPLGDDLIRAARQVLSSHESAMWEVDQFASGRRGVVRIAAMPSVAVTLLPTVVARFRHARPDVAIRLVEGPASRVHQALEDHTAEIGVTWHQHPVPLPPGFTSVPLLVDRIVAVLPATHALSSRTELSWAELAEHPIVALGPDASSRRLTDRTLESIGASQVPLIEVGSAASVGAFVAARLGVAAMSGLVTGLLGDRVKTLPLVEPEVQRTVCVFWNEQEAGPASRQFVEELATASRRSIDLPPHVEWARGRTDQRSN